MLWERWIPKSYLIKTPICGVECVCFNDDQIQYNYSIVTSNKNKLAFLDKGTENDLEDVLKKTKKQRAPVLISITGKGVITKKIMFSENDSLNMNDLIKQHLPTIHASEFYCQFYKCSNNTGYLAVCRKEQVNRILESITSQKQECVNVFVGALVCNALAPVVFNYNTLQTSCYDIELSNGFVDTIIPANSNNSILKIDSLEIKANDVIPFASCFGYLTQQTIYVSDNSELTILAKQHLENTKLKALAFAFIAIIFLVSVVNSVFFFQKFEENNVLETELNLYESKNAQITQLLESYQKKKQLIEQAGIFNNQHLSVFADKIAASLPDEIVLRELNFNPIEQETEEDSLVDFNEKQLIIKGNCNKSLLLNEWINVLKSQSFVKSANLENFIYNSEGHQPNFVLKLETN